MQRILMGLLIICLMALTSACATITRGSNDTLVIETDPPSAEARLSNGLTCKTPCSLKMKRKEACVVKIERAGYEPVEVNITPQISGAGGAGMAGNVLFGGLIGAAVDAGSGAMYDLKPNPVVIKLVEIKPISPVESLDPAPSPSPAAIREKTIEERLKECDDLKENGSITEEEHLKLREKILTDL
jgi:hypothetical protein